MKVKLNVVTNYNGAALAPGNEIDVPLNVAQRWFTRGIAHAVIEVKEVKSVSKVKKSVKVKKAVTSKPKRTKKIKEEPIEEIEETEEIAASNTEETYQL